MERTGESGRAGGRAGESVRWRARVKAGNRGVNASHVRVRRQRQVRGGSSAYACPRTSLAEKLKSKPKRRGAKEKGAG